MQWAKALGFDTVEYEVVTPNTIDSAIANFKNKIETGKMGRPSDGLVLTFRDTIYGKSLGNTAKAPRHSMAFKWQDEEAETRVTGCEWSVGKSGVITPVIEFEPIDIEGSTVRRASSHNISIFCDMEYGIGDRIKVFKANMIIPQISANLDCTGTIEIPGFCPCCGCETEIHEDPKSGVLTLWCMNADCEAKGNRLFKHFVSRDAMNIDGISGATLEDLCSVGIVTDLPSIFHIADHRSEIVNMDGYGERSYINMVNAIEKARNVKIANLIYALGIPNIGLATAKLICKNFANDLANTVSATYNDLINIDGIGDVIADSFVGYFNDEKNLEQFIRLVKELHIVKEEISTDTSMAGVTICVTGAVNIFPNRDAVKAIIESKGGKLTGSVSRSTNYLVTNDTTSGSRKNKAAQEYGIPILTEQEFIDKFNIEV
jgi:DNA ligase (NAD+)